MFGTSDGQLNHYLGLKPHIAIINSNLLSETSGCADDGVVTVTYVQETIQTLRKIIDDKRYDCYAAAAITEADN